MIRQTDGFLDVESKEATKGKKGGTTFLIYLPRANESESETLEDEDAPAEMEAQETRDLTATERILLVEDEDAVRTFSQRALTNKGYEILAAENGEHALRLIEENKEENFDMVVSDVVMPNMDGPAMAREIRVRYPDMPILFMSGYAEEQLRKSIDLDNVAFLPKPFSVAQIAEAVGEILAEHAK